MASGACVHLKLLRCDIRSKGVSDGQLCNMGGVGERISNVPIEEAE